jgi:hypothetical protein
LTFANAESFPNYVAANRLSSCNDKGPPASTSLQSRRWIPRR